MYRSPNTYYTEEHSISFGDIVEDNFRPVANTWTTWHLIPSSRPTIAHPTVATKFVEIPGGDGALDLTNYLTGGPVYGMRTGSLSFYIDNDHEHYEYIREKIMATLHGKRLKMVLDDDPSYYYEGVFTVGNLEPGAAYSSISISYQLDPYKLKIASEGAELARWDTFNFERDYDYYEIAGGITVNSNTVPKEFDVYSGDFPFSPVAVGISGTVGVTFRTTKVRTVNAGDTVSLPISKKNGKNKLTVVGKGTVLITWRGGAL